MSYGSVRGNAELEDWVDLTEETVLNRAACTRTRRIGLAPYISNKSPI